MTILVFYSVGNELNWGRHEFDCLSYEDAFRVIWANQEQLNARFYNMSTFSFSDSLGWHEIFNAVEFAEDYNNEDYDGGWWVYACEIDEEKVRQIIETNGAI